MREEGWQGIFLPLVDLLFSKHRDLAVVRACLKSTEAVIGIAPEAGKAGQDIERDRIGEGLILWMRSRLTQAEGISAGVGSGLALAGNIAGSKPDECAERDKGFIRREQGGAG